MFRKKSLSDELFLHCSSKVQNLTVFSIVYMIRIRFVGQGELNQRTFSAAQYFHTDPKLRPPLAPPGVGVFFPCRLYVARIQ